MIHIPVLRRGRPYRSLELARVPHFRSREPFVEVSQANAGLVRRDLLEPSQQSMRDSLAALSMRELLEICGRAAQRGWKLSACPWASPWPRSRTVRSRLRVRPASMVLISASTPRTLAMLRRTSTCGSPVVADV